MEKMSRPTVEEVRTRIEETEPEILRLAMQYQFLICGRRAEVCGYSTDKTQVYAVQYNQAFRVMHHGTIEAVLFANRSAKRKGFFRPCMVPVDQDHEPWAKPLYKFLTEQSEGHPFKFGDTWGTSMNNYGDAVTEAFKGFYWPRVGYVKSVPTRVTQDQILKEGINMENKDVYLVDLEDGPQWCLKVDGSTFKKPVKVPSAWKPATSHVIRKVRTLDLNLRCDFNDLKMAIYGGWTFKTQNQDMPDTLKHYLYDPIHDPRQNIQILIRQADTYFQNLCRPVRGAAAGSSYLMEGPQ